MHNNLDNVRDGVGSGRARDFCFRSDENINISMRSQ